MTKDIDIANELKSITLELFEKIGIKAEIQASHSKNEETGEQTVEISIESPEQTGLLIGSHGSTLNAIQVFLGMAARQILGEWIRVVVNIGDWKEKQEEQLLGLAQNAASRVVSTGEAQRLYNLTPSQRRVIHLHFLNDKDIKSESEGEGEDRHLVLSLRK